MIRLLVKFQAYRRRRLLERVLIPVDAWQTVTRTRLVHYALTAPELDRLHEMASLFLHDKVVSGVGLAPTELQKVTIAALACLPVLALGLDWYRGFSEVILYPDTFAVRHAEVDDAGVVHEGQRALGGESWLQGPVILSWEDVEAVDARYTDYNVVFHEFAHKLDMRSGAADGMPPLHRDMDARRWALVFQQAFDELERGVDEGDEVWMDAYGAENPAEFFAVASETFFGMPHRLMTAQSELYDQLVRFYRQDPATRHAAVS